MDYQSNNLVVPRGSILFSKFRPGTFAGEGFRQLGNCPEFNLQRDAQFLEHRSSQKGTRLRDKRLPLGSDLGATIITDDMSAENWQYWTGGELTTVTTASATAQTETLIGIKKGRIYQIGKSAVAPTGLRGISALSVEEGATTHTALTDYVLDGTNGLLTILSGGTIPEEADLELTYNVAASTLRRNTFGEQEMEGELMFVSNNPFQDMPNSKLYIPRATISANGDLSMMTDPDSPTWQQIPLTIAALQLGDMALAYRDDIPVL